MSIRKRINRLRNLAITFILIGFVVMYAGIYFRHHIFLMTFCVIIGSIMFILCTLFYSWLGILALKSVTVTCPSCGKKTKMYGKVDICMHCKEALTLEKELEGKAYDDKYNYSSPNISNTTNIENQ